MKNLGKNRVKLGIFVTVGILLFVIGIYYIGAQQMLFSPTVSVKSIFKDVNGLRVGNNVRFGGIDIGTVKNIVIITDTSIEVEAVIDKDVRKFIKKDATANVASEGFIGDKIFNISSGSASQPSIEDGDYITAVDGNNLDAILGQVKIAAENVAFITDDVADITWQIRNGEGAIGKIFMDKGFARNLDSTLVNIKTSAEGFSDNMEALKHNILLRGYYKKKARQKEKEQDSIQQIQKK